MKDSRTRVSGGGRSGSQERGLGGPPSRDWGHRAGLGLALPLHCPRLWFPHCIGVEAPQRRAHGTSLPCDGLGRPSAVCPRSRAHSPGGGQGWTPTFFSARSLPTWAAHGAAPSLRAWLAFCLKTKCAVSLFTASGSFITGIVASGQTRGWRGGCGRSCVSSRDSSPCSGDQPPPRTSQSQLPFQGMVQ